MSEILSLRRYYLLKRFYARLIDLEEGVWQSKQEEQAGVALPANFPHRAQLVSTGYSTVEDLNGSDVEELNGQGFTHLQAQAILAALAPLI